VERAEDPGGGVTPDADEPRHERHYTLAQATAAIPIVTDLLARMRDARDRLGDAEAREALSEAAPGNGGGNPGRTVSTAFVQLRDALAQLRGLEIVLRDLDRGLVDFPAMREGREVYLCWHEGEDEIAFWHECDSGFSGRRPLDDG
jgi:hypothetical protein